MEYVQFYEDMNIGTVMALIMNADGSPKEFIKPDLHKGRTCYGFIEVSWKMGYDISTFYGPKLPEPKDYRKVSKEEAQQIDNMTEYSMYQIFAAFSGLEQKGEFFRWLGKEGEDWVEVTHKNLKPSLCYHKDIALIQSTQDFWHPKCAGKAFGIEVINKVITMQRQHSPRHIVEDDKLFAEAPKDGADNGNNIITMVTHENYKADFYSVEFCSGCSHRIQKKAEE